MERAKLANGSMHELQIGRSPSPAEQDQMDAARSASKKGGPDEGRPEKGKACTAAPEKDE
jgi:hypothetical protein